MKAGNPLVEFSLRDSRVTPDSRIADVLQTALDRPLPHLAFLDLSMDGTQHLPLRSTWTQHTGLKALSLLGSQWISQHPEPAGTGSPATTSHFLLRVMVTMQPYSPNHRRPQAANRAVPFARRASRLSRLQFSNRASPSRIQITQQCEKITQ
jgi:hypothetical protein